MITLLRVTATLSLAVLLGGGGYWAGTNSFIAVAQAAETAPIIYYRHPDGVAQFSAVPKAADDGRPFVAVHASEDVSFSDNAPAPTPTKTADKGRILYYRNPMGLPDTSKVAKTDSMGMAYIPVYEGEQPDSSIIKVPLGKLQRTGVKTAIAEMAAIGRKLHIPGTITLDERRISVISMRADSFIDDVANVTTGDYVSKGDTLFRFFSKEIAVAASELVTDRLRSYADGNTGAMRKLLNLGVAQETIDIIARTRQVPASITYTAPRDGVVLERTALTGMMAKPGDTLFRIADTSDMWVIADVPEYDLASIKLGAKANITIRSLPGHVFNGKVDLIYPDVNTQTRTVKLRIELPNPDGLLLANMYADVDIETGLPEPVVTVPNSAVIDSGDRQVVIVAKGEGRFEPHDVKLGIRGDNSTEIRDGIAAGDKVVVSANFLLDAESNLNAALSALMPGDAQP